MSEALTQPKPAEVPEPESSTNIDGQVSHEPQTDEEKAEVTAAAEKLKEEAATQPAEQTLKNHAADTQTEKSAKQIKQEQKQALLEWMETQDKKKMFASIILGKIFLGLQADTTLMFMKMHEDMRKK